MKRILSAACLLAAAATPAKAEPFDLRGYRLGMTLEEFRAMPYPDAGKFPGLMTLCTGDPVPPRTPGANTLKVTEAFTKAGIIRCMHFAPRALGSIVENIEAAMNVAGVPTYPEFEFIPNGKDGMTMRLFRISFGTLMTNWDQVLNAYTTKFGKPQEIKNQVVQNSFGATFPKITATWANKESSITLEQRKRTLRGMKIVYLYDTLARPFLDRMKQIKGNPADNL